MGLVGLYVTLAAVAVGGQVPQQRQGEVPAVETVMPAPVTLPVAFRLPAGREQRKPAALEGTSAALRLAPPPMPRDPFGIPSAQLWPSNSPVRMNLVGVKFGWEL